MKNILALTVVVFSLVGGALTAQAEPQGFGIHYPEISGLTAGIQGSDVAENSFGIAYPELP